MTLRSTSNRSSGKWAVMIGVCIATLLVGMASTITHVALPVIAHSLHAQMGAVRWVIAIYMLMITCLLIPMGRLADMYGLKAILVIGLTLFTIGSLMCGFAGEIHALIAFRALQGIGAAMIWATNTAAIATVFPSSEHGKAMGVLGIVVGASLTFGPAVGGFLIAASGWSWIFFINLPLALIAMLIIVRSLEAPASDPGAGFDFPGAVLILGSLTALFFALNQGPELGWRSPTILGCFGAFLILLLVLIMVEKRALHPLLDMRLFSSLSFDAANVAGLVMHTTVNGLIFMIPMLLTQILGYGPGRVGTAMAAFPVLAVMGLLSGYIADRRGARVPCQVGMGVFAVGLLMMAHLSQFSNQAQVITAISVAAFGAAFFMAPNVSWIMNAAPREKHGVASGFLATMRYLGIMTGIALATAAFSGAREQVAHAAGPAFAPISAFRFTMTCGAIITALGMLANLAKAPVPGAKQKG